MEGSQALMNGDTLSRAKCSLTVKFNDICIQATRFQTCTGSVLSTGPELSTMPQAWCEFAHNLCERGNVYNIFDETVYELHVCGRAQPTLHVPTLRAVSKSVIAHMLTAVVNLL